MITNIYFLIFFYIVCFHKYSTFKIKKSIALENKQKKIFFITSKAERHFSFPIHTLVL